MPNVALSLPGLVKRCDLLLNGLLSAHPPISTHVSVPVGPISDPRLRVMGIGLWIIRCGLYIVYWVLTSYARREVGNKTGRVIRSLPGAPFFGCPTAL